MVQNWWNKQKSEIENVKNVENDQFKISHLTVLILGQSGTGNQLLLIIFCLTEKKLPKKML